MFGALGVRKTLRGGLESAAVRVELRLRLGVLGLDPCDLPVDQPLFLNELSLPFAAVNHLARDLQELSAHFQKLEVLTCGQLLHPLVVLG